MRLTCRVLIAVLTCVALHPVPAFSRWGRYGTQVSINASYLDGSSIDSTPDGFGGIVFVWEQQLPDGTRDILAQRVDAFGVVNWTNSANVCVAVNDQTQPRIVADGTGGVIIAWTDTRNGNFDVFAQRLTSAGAPQWAANGVVVCNAVGDQGSIRLISDASARAIIVWDDNRSGDLDIYAQRLNSAGNPQWALNGASVIVLGGVQRFPKIVTDGSGGVIVVWEDNVGPGWDLYAQRLNVSGVMQWVASGVSVCSAVDNQTNQQLIADGSGGVFAAWTDHRSGTHNDVYAQRLNSAGLQQWTVQGVALTTSTNNQQAPFVATDGSGGLIVAWYDNTVTNADGYAQRLSANGSILWPAGGTPILVNAGNQYTSALEPIPGGGAIAIYTDYASTNARSIAQRIDSAGTPLWPLTGVIVRPGYPDDFPSRLATDGRGGFVVTIMDGRNGAFGDYELTAQRIEPRYGEWGIPEPVLNSALDNPADQGGKVVVRWTASDRDVFSDQSISHYSIWRSTDAAATASRDASESKIVADPKDISRDFAGSAVYGQTRPDGAAVYWEWVANQDATYFPSYSYTTATRQDSVAGEPAIHYFKIFSHSQLYPDRVWESADVVGYSVDNLAPAAPLLLTAQRVGADVHLKWNRAVAPDLRDYAVYRSTSTGVTPVAGNFLTSAEDTVLVDASAPTTALYYIVTAYDVHDNQSAPSNEANVNGSTGVGNAPIPTSLTLQSNMPNPFNGETTLRVGLPAKSDVTIEVYDVAGRRVAVRSHPAMGAGWREVAFDGRDDAGRQLASGVYFSRVTAAGETRTQKIVIQR